METDMALEELQDELEGIKLMFNEKNCFKQRKKEKKFKNKLCWEQYSYFIRQLNNLKKAGFYAGFFVVKSFKKVQNNTNHLLSNKLLRTCIK